MPGHLEIFYGSLCPKEGFQGTTLATHKDPSNLGTQASQGDPEWHLLVLPK